MHFKEAIVVQREKIGRVREYFFYYKSYDVAWGQQWRRPACTSAQSGHAFVVRSLVSIIANLARWKNSSLSS